MNEIKVAHVHIETPLVLSCEHVCELIVESPSEFYSMVNDLVGLFGGGEGRFVFSRDGTVVAPASLGELVVSAFDLTDEKKTVSALYKKIETAHALTGSLEAEGKLHCAIAAFFAELFEDIPVPLDYDEPSVSALLKACAVRPSGDYDSLVEKLICAIDLAVALKRAEFFVFVDLKSVIDDVALTALFRHCQMEKVALFLVESCARRPLLDFESGVRITDDLCEILA